MKNLAIQSIIEKGNNWINNLYSNEDIVLLENGMKEYTFCYAFLWCKRSEINLTWEKRATWLGVGRLLVSKDGKTCELEGSNPSIDWVHHFELKVQELEEYWYLEIPYSKENISKLKAILKVSTPGLLKMLNEDKKIIYTAIKDWMGHFPDFYEIAFDLKKAGVEVLFEVKQRSITK
ncbi:MAG: hypothetical protein NXI20_00480 [bacterium]|nr:hypothetical protein [bacterium]